MKPCHIGLCGLWDEPPKFKDATPNKCMQGQGNQGQKLQTPDFLTAGLPGVSTLETTKFTARECVSVLSPKSCIRFCRKEALPPLGAPTRPESADHLPPHAP